MPSPSPPHRDKLSEQILAVYHTCPVMIVAETAEDTIVELSLNELAEVYECLPPPLWQALVQQYHVFQVR